LMTIASADPAQAEPDYAAAMKLYHKAADQGYAGAELALGEASEKGNGVRQDYSEAMRWYQKAANQGYAEAQQAITRLREKLEAGQRRAAAEKEAASHEKTVPAGQSAPRHQFDPLSDLRERQQREDYEREQNLLYERQGTPGPYEDRKKSDE
jgi:TPR repeat protein